MQYRKARLDEVSGSLHKYVQMPLKITPIFQ